MNKASKEGYNKNVTEKMWCIDVFLMMQEVSTDEAIQRVLSMPMSHSNNDVV